MKKIKIAVLQNWADYAIANAPNSDWQKRGGAKITGAAKLIPVFKTTDWQRTHKPLGYATVAYAKFANPIIEQFGFRGFTIAVMFVQGQYIYSTTPVCGKLRDHTYSEAAHNLSRRFCPQCGTVDTVKSRSKVVGPECVRVTYYCEWLRKGITRLT